MKKFVCLFLIILLIVSLVYFFNQDSFNKLIPVHRENSQNSDVDKDGHEMLISKVVSKEMISMLGKSKDEVSLVFGEGESASNYSMETEINIKYDNATFFFHDDTKICYGMGLPNASNSKSSKITLDEVEDLIGRGACMAQIFDGREICFKEYYCTDYKLSDTESISFVLQLYTDINNNITDIIIVDDVYAKVDKFYSFEPKKAKSVAKDYVFPKFLNPLIKTKINDMCRDFFEENNLMGLSVGVLIDGKVSYFNYGYSKEGGDPITEDSIFEIASLTKTFTGILLADMELEGKLDKTDPAQKYLKGKVKLPEYYGTPLTLQDLATHSSDLSRNPYNLFDDFETEFDCEYDNLTIEDVYEALGQEYIRYEPGTTYTYSNFAFGLLGHILSLVEEKTFDEMVEERITSMLGMKNTRSHLTKEQQKVRTTGHNSALIEMVNFHFGALEACGSLKSTTSDMVRYMAANMGVLDSDLADAIIEAHEVHFIGDNKTVGLGWHMFNNNGDIVYDHNGITPGYRSSILFIKDKNVGVVLMTNTAHDLNDLNIELISYLQDK